MQDDSGGLVGQNEEDGDQCDIEKRPNHPESRSNQPTESEGQTISVANPGSAYTVKGDEHSAASLQTPATFDPADGLSPPPLPARPTRLDSYADRRFTTSGSLRLRGSSPGVPLQSKATTALSLAEIHTQSRHDGSSSRNSPHSGSASRQRSLSRLNQHSSRQGSDVEESASVGSYIPILDSGGDVESLLGDVLSTEDEENWKTFVPTVGASDFFEGHQTNDTEFEAQFEREFDELEDVNADGSNEEALMKKWHDKLKHFFILSSAGKPIYSRHGDDQLISSSVGILQTIISFYQSADDELRCFVSGNARFVILSKGHLHLAAISRMGETDSQLRGQLEALYMQILSTLTLPKMKQMFLNRPSTDLRRPLQGTETLLSALSDGFTRGSPSTLLGALECLRMRRSDRQNINNALLKAKTPNLLYGLVVAGGRLVSVLRPKKQSLYPGDLQLIFNMLFEADGIRAGGGENWIPLCLPGFNNTGYLYMYVSFLEPVKTAGDDSDRPNQTLCKDEELAIILISRDNESFYELRKMRDDLINQFEQNGSMSIIHKAMRKGRPSCADILPGTVIRHFLYKSRSNVQFTMPSSIPGFERATAWRKLLCIYHTLNGSVHNRTASQKISHCITRDFTSLAWVTPTFELYCVAGSATTRNAVSLGANKIVQWARREEERLFIIGGAVF